MGTPGSVEMVQFFSSLVFWESISSTYPGLSPVACLSKLPQGAILEICETFDQSDDLAWPDTLFPNRETAMLSGSMLNTRNSLKYIRMKGEREVRVQLEGKYWTSNLSHLPQLQLDAAHLPSRIPCILFCRLDRIYANSIVCYSTLAPLTRAQHSGLHIAQGRSSGCRIILAN